MKITEKYKNWIYSIWVVVVVGFFGPYLISDDSWISVILGCILLISVWFCGKSVVESLIKR